MPLVAHNALPTFERLRAEGEDVLSVERAQTQDIRELHVGLLNMMPDAALLVTEKQYMRLIGACNRITQIYVYPFSVPGLARSPEALAHIEAYYSDFDDLKTAGLDALIISGANVTNPALDLEPFWEPLQEVVTWAASNVTSILCSCLATHALVKHLHGIDRRPFDRKLWGVYRHRVCDREHPLTQDVNTRFDAPHSRWNDIPRQSWDGAGLHVLAEIGRCWRPPGHQPGWLPHRLLPGPSRVRPQLAAQGVQARGGPFPGWRPGVAATLPGALLRPRRG